MTGHDQFFKRLFQTFFEDLLRLVAPELLSVLRVERAQFRDQQSFTDWPAGSRREVDLLAEVERSDGEPPVLVHVEIESRSRRTMSQRLWQYYMQLRLRDGLHVVPILVNLRGGPRGVTRQTQSEGLVGLETARFQYCCFGISGCLAEDYLARPEPLAWALAALMRSNQWNRVEQKVECLRRIAAAETDLSEIEALQLVNCVETYLQLTPTESAAFAALQTAAGKEVSAMQLTWADRMIAKGLEEGLQKGREEGIQKGREEGFRQGLEEGVEKGLARSLRSLKGVVLRMLGQRFGKVPARVRRRIEAISTLESLERIAGEILTARSLDEVHLG